MLLASCNSLAQKIDISLDYTVTYVIPKSNDTIRLSIGDSGKMIFTDSKSLAKEFGSSFGSLIPTAPDQTDAKILLDLKANKMYMEAKVADNVMLMNLDIMNFIPKPTRNADSVAVRAELNGETHFVMDRLHDLYNIISDSKEGISFKMAFDENYPLDFNNTFSPFIQLITGGELVLDFPSGVILYAEDANGAEVLRAIDIRNEAQRIEANFNLNQIFPQ